MDIKLSAEEAEVHGVHLRLPDNSELQHSEADANYYQTRLSPDDPITEELVVSITFNPSEKLALGGASANGANYTPEAALIHWSDLYANNDTWTVKDKTYIGGANALVITATEESSINHKVYERTVITLALNSGIVGIEYKDLGGRYGELIQESINTIRIDEGEIPEIARVTSPEGLQAAGLRVQPWQIDCESFGVYLNVPEDYTPTAQDDGSYAWASPDGGVTISASTIDAKILSVEQGRLEANMAQSPGFEGFDEFYQGTLHDMFAIKFKHRTEGADGVAWAYVAAVSPRMAVGLDSNGKVQSGEAVAVAVTSRSGDDAEAYAILNTLRYADGWNNGGVLDVKALAASH